MPRTSFEQVLQEELARDPYLAALWEATKDAEDTDAFDDLLAAFPEREEWEAHQLREEMK